MTETNTLPAQTSLERAISAGRLSADPLAQELAAHLEERLCVNVGLIAENTELKRQAPMWTHEGLTRIVVGAIRSTVDAHGNVVQGSWTASLAKRIVNQVVAQ